MSRLVLSIAVGVFGALISYIVLAQTPVVPQTRPNTINGYLVVTTCGTLPSGFTYPAGSYQAGTINTTGVRC
jgi:hypothetical protein